MDEKQKLKGKTGFEQKQTAAVSPWMLSVVDELGNKHPTSHWTYSFDEFAFEIVEGQQSLWITSRLGTGGRLAFRVAYCPDGELKLEEVLRSDIRNGIELKTRSTLGDFLVQVEFPLEDRPLLHFKTTLIPAVPLSIPFWPRDISALGNDDDLTSSEGIIYAHQTGTRSGLVYFSMKKPRGGTVLYFQNLTSLNDYARQTETSLADTVGGEWPELGFALPATSGKALDMGKEITLSDAYVIFDPKTPRDDLEMSKQFLDMLAQVYLALPRVETDYIHWPEIAEKSLKDLSNPEKCWTQVKGRSYLTAYVGDADTPPESMVQLTVLLPLLEYSDWIQKEIPIVDKILSALPHFFDDKVNALGRWLSSEEKKLDGSEPQKQPRVMDSWYLYHSLLNLSRLAERGDKAAQKLFIESTAYAIKVAHRFEYHWPVFYNLDTLDIVKARTKEGEGGETDVAGIYTHLMLQAWKLTEERTYLEEARTAAKSLKGLGFNMFYQANEVLFAAGAMLRLWKETGDEEFLDLSYLCLANIYNNMWLWECNYGYAEHYKTFFALFPLKDAPYTAVYEELEGFAALHDYLEHFDGDTPEALNILIAEFIRNMLYKASFYYPPNLPREVMTEEPKTGEIDSRLWIPLEDIYDGWETAGQVGQEVYGAGLPFAIVPRHYWRVPDGNFMIYVNYPTSDFLPQEDRAYIRVLGDPRFSCRLRIIPLGKKALPPLEIQAERKGEVEALKGHETPEGHLEYELFGDRLVMVKWEKTGKPQNGRKGNRK